MRARPIATAALATVLTLVLSPAPGPQAQDSPIFRAMQDEMKRSMAELRLPGEPPPYYIAYEISETTTMRAVARLGGLVDESNTRGRSLRVEVRVGDYAFDSSRFITQDRGAGLVAVLGDSTTALDDNYDVMRRQIWLTTDAAYKRAVSVFAKKKATFQNRAGIDALPDFSREKPVDMVLSVAPPASDRREWADRVRQLSAAGAGPGVDATEAWVSETRGTSYFLNTEGFKTVAPYELAYLRVSAETQGADGMPVRDLFSLVENRLEDLPAMPQLLSRARGVATRIQSQLTAPIGEEFTGPVLIEGEASAEIVRQTLVPLMLARRPNDAEAGGRGGGGGQAQATPFLTRIGLRVLSDAFSVSDTPSLKEFDGRPVPGAYVLDDEAVRAQDVTLVDKGRLVTLLTSRTPQRNLPQSNGHGRTGTVQPGVFQLSSAQAVPAATLKGKYLELLKVQDKPFGYIVRSVANPADIGTAGPGGPVILQAFKVTPDGKEELVRGLRFGGIASTSFRDILEASQERTLYNYRLNGATAASVIAPSLLFEELEIQRTRDILQKPPVVPSPLGK
ncbi:MAG: metallopeptidase TldD-related protein [Vicinamibacterales bacterium]